MSIKQRRLDRGWSQEDLAMHSGLSARTIQRIESGQKAGLESLKSLAAVFETTVSELMQEHNIKQHSPSSAKSPLINEVEREAIEFAQSMLAEPKKGSKDPLSRIERAAINHAKSLVNKFKL